jgi:hypothetical protein
VPGVSDDIGAATSCWVTGPDGGGTMAENALARMIAMSRPNPMPTAVWRYKGSIRLRRLIGLILTEVRRSPRPPD